jgi:hypothetical protein
MGQAGVESLAEEDRRLQVCTQRQYLDRKTSCELIKSWAVAVSSCM